MSESGTSIKFVLLATVCAVGGVAVLAAGVNYEDRGMIASGVTVIVGALVVVAMGVRGLLGLGNAPGAARSSVRGKMKHFWMPVKEAAGSATEERIAAAEKKLGVKLPGAYVKLLRVQDGGEPRYTLWAPANAPSGCTLFQVDSFHGTELLARIAPALVKEGCLPEGTVCICGASEDEWQLCLDYREVKGDGEPAVVAFDEESECHRLAGSFEEFVGGLTRRARAYVYAPQGVVGKAADGLVAELNEALGVELREYEDRREVHTAVHPRWRTVAGEAARFELRVNGVEGVGAGKRVAMFPETWSYRVLRCDVGPGHREELEGCLGRTGTKWVRVHGPVERLVGEAFYG